MGRGAEVGIVMPEREYWVDALKGFAIICVVLGHSIERTLVGLQIDNNFLTVFNLFIYSFHMPLFFFISGYVYAISDRDKIKTAGGIKLYIKNKFIDLFIPYCFFAILVFLGKYVFSDYVTYKINLNDLFFMFINPIAFLWFIYILFFISVLIGVLERVTQFNSILLICIFSIMLLVRCFVTTNIKLIDRVLFYPIFYYLGVIAENNSFIVRRRREGIYFIAFLSFFVLHYYKYNNMFYTVCVNLFGILFFATLFSSVNFLRNSKLLSFLGFRTLYIYIIHPIVLNIVRVFLLKYQIYPIMIWMITLILTGTICPIVYKCFADKFWIFDLPFRPRKYLKTYNI